MKGCTQLVFGEGNSDAEVLFIGEAPGFWEDLKGRPFVGNAGKLLDKLIESIGLKREEVYITNVVKCRPPENRDPLPNEIEAYAPYLNHQIEIIRPKIVVTLGRYSLNKFLPNARISEVHGRPVRVGDIIVTPMYHPAAALRSGAVMEALKEDFLVIREVLKNPAMVSEPSRPTKEKEIDPNQLTLF
ncbi:MAG: uracil-DNA glycosylase [Patescibacteria group bacterium]|nr:uracil-DNA glycosylase [Patescibacteria group bacterium]